MATSKKQQKPQPMTRRPVQSPAEIDRMLAVLVHNPDAYQALDGVLDPVLLARRYKPHALIWRLVREHVEKFAQLPGLGTLRTAITAALDETEEYNDDEIDTLNELMEYVSNPDEHDSDIVTSSSCMALAVEAYKNLVHEETATGLAHELIQNEHIIIDLPAILNQYHQTLVAVDALGGSELPQSFEDGWDKNEQARLLPCGVDILDDYMGGGWLPGECIVFMGPFGSCKTLLVICGVCKSIEIAARNYLKELKEDPNTPCPVVFLIFTEGTKKDYQKRLISNMAKVPWSVLNQMKSLSDLSNAKKPAETKETEYEKYITIASEAVFENEQTRVRKAVEILNKHLVMINCTTSDEATQGRLGTGGIPAIVSAVTRHLNANPGCYPLSFWLDHASALAARVVEGNEDELSRRLQLVLKDIPRLLKERLGVPYGAPVAIMHQLRGQANAFGPTANLTHADAADCKSFAEYADFAFTTTRPDDQNACLFRCTKHRRMPPLPLTVVQIDGKFNLLYASTKYTVQANAHKIVDKKVLESHTGHTLTPDLATVDADKTIHDHTEVP